MIDYQIGDKVLVLEGLYRGCTGTIAVYINDYGEEFIPDQNRTWVGVILDGPSAKALMKENLLLHSDIAEALYSD